MPSLSTQKPIPWITSLYLFQSIPFVLVSLIATMMYQQQGMNNTQSAFITSLLMIPWAIKPLFSPFLEEFSTKKRLTVLMQLLVSIVFFILALRADKDYFLIISLTGLTCLAFFSSIHDIVADGLYLINLDDHSQKRFVALRSFFYQMGRWLIKGGLLMVISQLAIGYGLNVWTVFFYCLFILCLLLTSYNAWKIPEIERRSRQIKPKLLNIYKSLSSCACYPSLFFIFIYNFSEAQMQKMIPLFLLDKAGLNFSLPRVGEIYGVSGGFALMTGTFISGFLITRYRLKSCLIYLTVLLVISHLLFICLTYYKGDQFFIIFTILFNQLAFGLANGAYMGYLLSVANKSSYPMSMYTICTSIMALSYVFFGALSGFVEQQVGYLGFFVYILIANGLLVTITYNRMNNHD